MRYIAAVIVALLPLAFAGWEAFDTCPNIAMDITCSRPDHCYLVGGYSNTPFGVYESTDFQTWDLADMKGFSPMIMSVDASPAGPVAAGGMGVGNYSAILASNDGKTFYNARMPMAVGQDIKAIRNNATSPARAAFAFVANTMLDNSDNLFFSNDGARSFTGIKLPGQYARYGSYPSDKLFFITQGTWPSSAKQLAADTLNHCLRKSQHICVPAGDLSFAQVRAHNERLASPRNDAYIGNILRSTDGGRTFEEVYSTNEYYFNDISCSLAGGRGEAVCLAVGEGATASQIYRSEDSGRTWTAVFSQSSTIMSSLFKVRFAGNGKTAFASGGNFDKDGLNGYVYGSTDGGRTWSVSYKQANVGMFVGLFISEDASYGAAVGITREQTAWAVRYTA